MKQKGFANLGGKEMTHKNFYLMIIISFLLGSNIWGFELNSHSTRLIVFSGEIKQSFNSVQNYTPRSPIWITNDNDLNNSFPGKGTVDDPIRIEGYNFTYSSGTLIYIRDTTFYFEITNNYLNGLSSASRGIYFYNVIHGTIRNNTISSCGQGITIYYSFNTNIINNTVNNNNYNGINVDYSDNNAIINNTISENIHQSGIWLDHANNNTISKNIVFNNNEDGIRILEHSKDNFVLNNTCYDNGWVGIRLQTSACNNLVQFNTAYNSGERGICVEESSNSNIITFNTLYNNSWSGIEVRSFCNNNIFVNNTIYSNEIDGIQLSESDNNTLINNSVSDNRYGILIWESKNNSIENNFLINNGFYCGRSNVDSYLQKSILNNSVNGKPLIYWKDKIGGIVPSNAGQIFLFNCTDITITDQVLSNTSVGLLTAYCYRLLIRNNTFYNTRYGIFADHNTNDSTITNNTGYNNNQADIQLWSAYHNILSNNTLGRDSNYGLVLDSAESNMVLHNTIFQTNLAGIWLLGISKNNIFTHNNICENEMYGITIEDASSDTILKFNDFCMNNIGGSQVTDAGSNNVFIFNHWSDWTSPDANADGIVDNSYSIEGTANNKDQYPLISSPSVHMLLPPVLLSPTGGEIFSSTINILWTSSMDTWEYSVTYDVFYSTDGGTTWTPLESNLDTTSFIWNTLSIQDGSNYLVKINATSSGGLQSTSLLSSPFTIDNTPPLLAIFSPQNQTYSTNQITIKLSGDGEGFWYFIESLDTQNQTWTGEVTRTLADGTYTLHAYAIDSAGNIAHVLLVFTIAIPDSTTTTTPSSTITTSATTTPTTTTTPSWSTLLLLLSLFAILSWKQRKKKS